MRKKRKYYKRREKERVDRSPIISIFTPIVIAGFLRGVLILRILLIIAALCILTYLLNKHIQQHKNKIRVTILSWIITLLIIIGGLHYGYTKVGIIHDKFNEIGKGFSKIINLGQNKKGNIELQLNKLGIIQEVLTNMNTSK